MSKDNLSTNPRKPAVITEVCLRYPSVAVLIGLLAATGATQYFQFISMWRTVFPQTVCTEPFFTALLVLGVVLVFVFAIIGYMPDSGANKDSILFYASCIRLIACGNVLLFPLWILIGQILEYVSTFSFNVYEFVGVLIVSNIVWVSIYLTAFIIPTIWLGNKRLGL